MHDIQNFVNQQVGFSKWTNYNSSLKRLRCLKDEEYRGILVGNEELETPIFACKFAQKSGYEYLLAIANEDGKLLLHDTNNKKEQYSSQIHHNAIFDIAWITNSLKLVTVSGDHTARLVDVANGDINVVQIFNGHTRSVKTVAVRRRDSSVFATGSRDGSIRVWDVRSSLSSNLHPMPDRSILNSHCSKNNKRMTPTSSSKRKSPHSYTGVSAANSVTGLAFQDEDTLISCGSGDGVIKVWDLRKTYLTSHTKNEPYPKNIIPYSGTTTRNGFSNLIIDKNGHKLYANCLDNTIYCYNILSYNVDPIMEYKGHCNSSFYIKSVLSNDDQYLLSGSSDQNAYIWNVNNTNPIIKLVGHTAEVTCVAWRQKGDTTLVTCSDDVRHKIWRVGFEMLPENWEIEGRGIAELMPKTPTQLKRVVENNEKTPQSQVKRMECDICQYGELQCENCVPSSKSNKRSLCDAFNSEPKRQHTGRRLFKTDEEPLAIILEENEQSDLFKTPTSSATNRNKRESELKSPDPVFSPTTNLPNFVVDGSAPHLHFSPQKQRDKDWLTTMRVEKSLIKDMYASGGPSPKTSKFEDRSPRSRPIRRRNSRTTNSPQSPLLKFFRVTNSSIMKDSQCNAKSSLLLLEQQSTLDHS